MASKRREQAKKSKATRKAEMYKGGGQSAYALRKARRATDPSPGSPFHPSKSGSIEVPILGDEVES